MESNAAGLLVGSEIHGFHTLHDLDVGNMMEEAKMRWLRPNEIHAILCNYKYFTINAKPITLPKSGTISLFDRKMLRNFRRDGHNWKKKKDGKTVKEAHEHLKVGNDERIHVYYAHGQDNSTFVRRCYWLLDKKLEHIVLVHYRETQEIQGSPSAPLNSNSNSSSVSDPSAPWHLSEELDSGANRAHYLLENGSAVSTEPVYSSTVKNHEFRLHELNTLEWDQLVTEDVSTGDSSNFKQQNISESGFIHDSGLSPGASSLGTSTEPLTTMGVDMNPNTSEINFMEFSNIDGLQGQDSLGKWMNYIIAENHLPNSADDLQVASSHSSGYYASSPLTMSMYNQELSSPPESVFRITDVAPAWAYSTEKTKILITGIFDERHLQPEKSNLFCICGDVSVPVEVVQGGGFRCFVPPHPPGLVGLYLSFDGHKNISQVIDFEYRAPVHDLVLPAEEKPKWEELQLQMRLAFLLFSTSKCLDIASSNISLDEQKNAKKFATHTTNISKDWAYFLSSVEENRTSFLQAKETAFELMLKNRLKDWILERVITGCKISEFDIHGQAVIHLCSILGYTWSVQLFSWSGFSLDFRDKFGWTALHWAAYCGREKMVAKLLSAGAKPNLVTDPTSGNPCGSTAADLASKKGFEGLSAYLAEKALVQHFNDMSLAGNISGSLSTTTNDALPNHDNSLTEEDSYLKDSLTAYRTAADAAARIQSAFRENSLKIRTKQVQYLYEEDEARSIIAALRIQHAFRNFESKKKLAAAARIQYTFRTWKMRREFLNLRKQAIRIQAVFRGYQVRRQHQKILWSVGVVEKAILRWRLKRKGFRGMEIKSIEEESVHSRDESDPEEDFFKTSRRQAEERLDRSVVRVQAMFRSKKAQEEYRRMKLAHDEAKLEYDEMNGCDDNMER